MLHLVKKWYPEDDPLTSEQIETLLYLLGDHLTETALEGFLIVCSRFVDEVGNHRTAELANIFRTHNTEGKRALLHSLEYMRNWIGGIENYKHLYPVTVVPPRPAFPQFKIIGIETISNNLYRVLGSKSKVYPTDELVKDYIQRTGRLPYVPRQRHPVRRSKPRFHWCSYEKWKDPESTIKALQILPEWENDAQLRVTLFSSNVRRSAFVAFNGDEYDPNDNSLRFYKYFYEPLAQDHPPLCGGGLQVGIQGAPTVDSLEQWDGFLRTWTLIWERPKRKEA